MIKWERYANPASVQPAKSLPHVQVSVSSYKDADSNSRQLTALIQKYFDIRELDAPTLNEIMSKIEVHEREIVAGEREQKVDIYYNFVGIIG